LKRKPRRRPSRSTRNSSPASRGSSHSIFPLHQSHLAVGCHRRAKKNFQTLEHVATFLPRYLARLSC
jgi:hypothetical protein